MANTFKPLFRGAASTSSTTLYTVPSATTTLVSSVLIVNTAASAATYDLLLDDVAIANDINVPANDTTLIEIKQVIESGGTIKGLASATTVNFHISGLEIT